MIASPPEILDEDGTEEEDGTLQIEDWWSSLKDGEYKAYLFDVTTLRPRLTHSKSVVVI